MSKLIILFGVWGITSIIVVAIGIIKNLMSR